MRGAHRAHADNDNKEHTMTTSTFKITGLTCGHCVNAVKEEVSELAGVESAEVDLVKGGESTLTIEADRALTKADITPAIEEAGESYAIVG